MSGPVLRGKGCLRFELQLARVPLMLVMLGSVLSACGVILLLFLPLSLLSLNGSLIVVGWLGVCFLYAPSRFVRLSRSGF